VVLEKDSIHIIYCFIQVFKTNFLKISLLGKFAFGSFFHGIICKVFFAGAFSFLSSIFAKTQSLFFTFEKKNEKNQLTPLADEIGRPLPELGEI